MSPSDPHQPVACHARGAWSRRTLLRSGLGTGVALSVSASLSGCALNNPFDSTQTPAPQAVPDLSPDVALAVQAVTAIRLVQDRVEATGRRHPRLHAPLELLTEMHRAHLRALVDAVPDQVDTSASGTPAPVPAGPAAARRKVLADEAGLHDQLTGFAMRAESGPFARLLGAIAASVSQHRSVLA